MNIKRIQEKLQTFATERDWDQFHTPKNLAMALAGEAGELVEIFQWLTPEESIDIVNSDNDMALVNEELADVFIYALRLADKLDINIEKAINQKIKDNEAKYPVSLSRGNATKYNRR